MKGRVLGATAQGGAIQGEDGRRYAFGIADWRSQSAPMVGDEIDFETRADGQASEIYCLRSGATVDFGAVGDQAKALLGGAATSPIGARIMALLTGNPVFQISLVVLVASCLLTYVKLGSAIIPQVNEALPDHGVYKIISVGDLIDYVKTGLAAVAESARQLEKMTAGSGAMGVNAENPFGVPAGTADKVEFVASLANILYLVYLVPIGAAATLVQLVRRANLSVLPLATGVMSVLSFIVLIVARSTIISSVKQMGNPAFAELAGKAISFGFGSYLILLCGLALIGISMGLIRLPQRA